MTKKEHMVELKIDTDDDLEEKLQRLEESGYSLNTALKNYADAINYGWDDYIKQYPEVQVWYQLRSDLIELINRIDQKIDETIESIDEKSED